MRWLSGVPVGLRSHFVGATPDTLDLNGRLRRGSLCHEVACRAVAGETSEGWWARQIANFLALTNAWQLGGKQKAPLKPLRFLTCDYHQLRRGQASRLTQVRGQSAVQDSSGEAMSRNAEVAIYAASTSTREVRKALPMARRTFCIASAKLSAAMLRLSGEDAASSAFWSHSLLSCFARA